MAHRWPEDEEENFVPWMEVPEPTTIRRLWTYLYEARAHGSHVTVGSLCATFRLKGVFPQRPMR
jgi:hypothetical protein